MIKKCHYDVILWGGFGSTKCDPNLMSHLRRFFAGQHAWMCVFTKRRIWDVFFWLRVNEMNEKVSFKIGAGFTVSLHVGTYFLDIL